jgi:phosphohistidine phosphatase SixA
MQAGPEGDAARPLSPAGRRSVEQLGLFLAGTHWQPDRVFASPLVRAQETARTLSLGIPRRVETLPELDPAYEPVDVLNALSDLEVRDGHVTLVGHQPLLARLCSFLEGAPERRLAPGGLIRLAFDEDLGRGLGRLELERGPGSPVSPVAGGPDTGGAKAESESAPNGF